MQEKHPREAPAAKGVVIAVSPCAGTASAPAPKVVTRAPRPRAPRTCAPRRTAQRSGRPAARRASSSSRTASPDPPSSDSDPPPAAQAAAAVAAAWAASLRRRHPDLTWSTTDFKPVGEVIRPLVAALEPEGPAA